MLGLLTLHAPRTFNMPQPLRCILLGSFFALLHCQRSPRSEELTQPLTSTESAAAKPAKAGAVVPALDVSLRFPATESVGAKRRIHLEAAPANLAHSPPEAWKIELEKTGDFGGICWKNRAGNEGEAPGEDLSKGGYRRISFFAKGALGGEVAEFRAGGLGDIKTRYRDSFDVTAGRLELTPTWTEYSIYVSNVDLSSVMTPFCVLLHREDNATGAIIYLDDIQYRG
jgi:hypothetical protein